MATKRSLMTEEEKAEQRQLDRERKAKKRQNMTEEEKEIMKQSDRTRKSNKAQEHTQDNENKSECSKKSKKEIMALKRASMNEDEKALQRQKDRERKARKKVEQVTRDKESPGQEDESNKKISNENVVIADSQEGTEGTEKDITKSYLCHEKKFNRLCKMKIRGERSIAAHEYEKIYNLLCMRKLREKRSGKEHLMDNKKARKGMRVLKDEGRLIPFQNREFREIKEVDIWLQFTFRGQEFKDILAEKNPAILSDIQNLIDEQNKEKAAEEAKRKEMKAKEQAERDKGFWEFNYMMDFWEWTGLKPPGPDDPDPNNCVEPPQPTFSEKEVREFELKKAEWRELELKWFKETMDQWAEEDRQARNRKAREKYQKKKEELQKPIEMPELPEMSEYEKIREQNIRERDEALRAAGFSIKN